MNFREAIFDLDGTLLDSLPGIEWSAEQALAACGKPQLSGTLRALLGPPIRAILETATGIRNSQDLDRLEQAFRSSYDSEGWRRTSCFEGAPGALAELQNRGVRLWVATNKNRLATGMILAELGVAGYFQEVMCRDSRTPRYDSKAEMLVSLLQQNDLAPAECLMIGDTREDWHAAAHAGISCVLVKHGYGMDTGDCELIEDWSSLLDLFEPPAAAAPGKPRMQND